MFAVRNERFVADVLLIRHSWRRRNDRIEAEHSLICGGMGSMRRVFALLRKTNHKQPLQVHVLWRTVHALKVTEKQNRDVFIILEKKKNHSDLIQLPICSILNAFIDMKPMKRLEIPLIGS